MELCYTPDQMSTFLSLLDSSIIAWAIDQVTGAVLDVTVMAEQGDVTYYPHDYENDQSVELWCRVPMGEGA